MRVISGAKKGIKLINPDDYNIRPTSDKVKEALFDIIAFETANSRVLDLFAGTGALGIEALSRDAAFCVFVDNSKSSVELLKKNLAKTRLNQRDSYMILNMNFLEALNYLSQRKSIFDLVLIDPPYHGNLYEESLRFLDIYQLVGDNSVVILELSNDVKLADNLYGFSCYKEKKYSKTVLKFYTKENA
jgi:16S rRNA (guanine(966)-N(2))-methyltransferase RsmD